ncbi:hypothetical protein Tco_0673051 [Tanacetum coccineum]
MRPPGFNQPNVQNNRYQGNNFNSNQNRGGNFNQNRPNNQGAVYQAPPYQPPTNRPLINQALPPISQIQGVSKTDFESYAKANDANMNNLQMKLNNFQRNQNDFQRSYNDSQKKQDDFQNMMLGFMQNYHNNSITSTSRSGTLPSQTTPLVPTTPVVSTPQKEPEQNPETSIDKVQKPSSENTAQVPPPGEEDSIFIEILKPRAKKTVNVEIQEPNSPRPNSYQPKLPYPERMKVRENDKPSAQHSWFLKMFKQLHLEIGLKDALVEMPKFNKWLSSLLRNKEKLEEIAIITVNAECFAIIMNKVPEKLEDQRKISYSIFSYDDHVFVACTTTYYDVPSPSSSPVKTSDNFEKFINELAPLDSLPSGNDDSTLKKDLPKENFQVYSNPLFEFDDNFKSSTINPLFDKMEEDVKIKNSNVSDKPVLLNTPLSDKVECFAPENDNDEIDAFLAMEVSSNFEEGYFDSEGDITFLDNLLSDDASHNLAFEFAGELLTLPSGNDHEFWEYLSLMTVLCEISTSQSQENIHANQRSVIESLPVSPIPVEDSVENDDSEDEDNELPNLDHQDDPSIPRPPPEPPDVAKCFEPEAGMDKTKKLQENSQKQASTDTRIGRAQKKPKMQSQSQKKLTSSQNWSNIKTWRQIQVTIHPSSPLVTQGKSRGFSQLKGTEDNSRARLQDGRERLVKSSFSLTHSQAKATWLWKKAQGELGFTLGSLREVTQGSHQGLPAWQSV